MKLVRRKKSGPGRPSVEDVLGRLDEEVQLLHDHLGGLPRAVEADHILRQIWIDDVHNSTAIEGNTMTRVQVENVVERREVQANLTEALDVEGYAEAADWVYRHAADYEGVPVGDRFGGPQADRAARVAPGPAGDPRRSAGRLAHHRRQGQSRQGIDSARDPSGRHRLESVHRSARGQSPVVHAAVHHAWLERIHPFVDGNGRVGRLILNFMLIQHGYPPAVILKEHRVQYLRALRTADAGNPNPLAEVIARSISDALMRLLIPNLAGDVELVPLSALAAEGPYPLTTSVSWRAPDASGLHGRDACTSVLGPGSTSTSRGVTLGVGSPAGVGATPDPIRAGIPV